MFDPITMETLSDRYIFFPKADDANCYTSIATKKTKGFTIWSKELHVEFLRGGGCLKQSQTKAILIEQCLCCSAHFSIHSYTLGCFDQWGSLFIRRHHQWIFPAISYSCIYDMTQQVTSLFHLMNTFCHSGKRFSTKPKMRRKYTQVSCSSFDTDSGAYR